jgi:hypothetical protein
VYSPRDDDFFTESLERYMSDNAKRVMFGKPVLYYGISVVNTREEAEYVRSEFRRLQRVRAGLEKPRPRKPATIAELLKDFKSKT